MPFHLNDPNILVVLGSILGIIGALILSIDALGAPDLLAALKVQKDRGINMAQIGYLALINRTFIYIFVSFISFVVVLMVSRGDLIISLLISPFGYFAWKLLVFITDTLAKFIEKLGPKNYTNDLHGIFWGLGCMIQLTHVALWILPFTLASLLAMAVRFAIDLPLTYISEKSIVPVITRIYELAAATSAQEEKRKFKTTTLIGSLFLLFGFLYQLIGELLLIKW